MSTAEAAARTPPAGPIRPVGLFVGVPSREALRALDPAVGLRTVGGSAALAALEGEQPIRIGESAGSVRLRTACGARGRLLQSIPH